jgi:uncharacterized protein YecE (DUF72 family)
MGSILVGISGWTEPTLIAGGKFYPPPVKSAEARLRYYSSQFPIVEVDSSYYGLPAELTSALWVKRTPDHFVFDIKSFRLFTQHPTSPEVLPKDIRDLLPPAVREQNKIYNRDLPEEALDELWKRFELSLRPLHDSGKLGVILFQFPSWFYPGRESREYIASFRARLPKYQVAIEFRHASWVSEKNIEQTMTFLKDNRLAYVCVDEPQGLNSGLPPVVAVTSEMSVIRFHGRNKIAWERENTAASGRFNYLYNEGELKEWQPRIKELADKTRELHVIFNNCYDDKAVRNASQIRLLLGQLNATSSLFS